MLKAFSFIISFGWTIQRERERDKREAEATGD